MSKAKKPQRGGVRPGAGRPVQFANLAKFSVTVDRESLDLLDHWRAAFGWSRSQAVRWMIPEVVGHTTQPDEKGSRQRT